MIDYIIQSLPYGDTIFIGQKIPQKGWVKLNFDRAYKDTLVLAGCGGLLCGGRLIGYIRKF
jgi:hypothetical protein